MATAPTIPSNFLGTFVSFTVYPSSILGSSYQDVKLLAILDYQTAMTYADVASMHANVYPLIPQADQPLNDFTSYSYLKIEFSSGQIGIIGIPWIVGWNTAANCGLTQVVNSTITVVVTGVSAADLPIIQQMLVMNGYNNISLTLT